MSSGRVHVKPGSSIRQAVPRSGLGLELVRAILLLAGSLLAVLVVLPIVLALAAAGFD